MQFPKFTEGTAITVLIKMLVEKGVIDYDDFLKRVKEHGDLIVSFNDAITKYFKTPE